MKRRQTDHNEIARTGEEPVCAFVPKLLPLQPALDLGGTRRRLLEQALLACGRLDGISALLPDPDLFLYAYVRRETNNHWENVGVRKQLPRQPARCACSTQ